MSLERRKTLALVTALVAAAPHAEAQQAPQNITYVTRDGDTCPAIAQRLYGSPTRIDVIHTYNTMGALPHRFRAGVSLTLPRVPPPMRSIADGEIVSIRNEVHAYTPDEHRARRGEPLSRGHRVGTFANSAAQLVLGDERVLQLDENALVVLLGRFSYQTGRRETAEDTRLESGTLRGALAMLSGRPAPQPLVVSTPSAQVAASPGRTVVTVDPQRGTRVSVHEGHAELRARGVRVQVAQGFGSHAALGQRPSPPRALPVTPTFARALTPLLSLGSPLEGELALGAGASTVARIVLQIARDEGFADVVEQQTLTRDALHFAVRSVGPGVYFVRARAVDSEGFESAPTAAQTVRVMAARIRPGGEGRLAAALVDDGVYCALDGGARALVQGPLALRPARAHELRCAAGAEGPETAVYAIAREDSGPVRLRARVDAVRWSDRVGTRALRVRVMDAAGDALDDLQPTLTLARSNDEGADTSQGERRATATPQLGELVATAEPGTYVATVRCDDACVAATVRLRVGDDELASVELDASRPPVVASIAPPRVIAPPAEPLPPRWDVGLGVGAVSTFSPLGVGFTGSIAGRYRYTGPRISLFGGVELSYARLGCSGARVPAQALCDGAGSAARVDVDAGSIGGSFGVGLGVSRVLLPYAQVTPQLVLARAVVSTTAIEPQALRPLFGLSAALGVQLELRPHAPFLEVGYRYAAVADERVGALVLGGLQLMLGYRGQW